MCQEDPPPFSSLAVLGGGNMGAAIVAGLLGNPSLSITVIDPDPAATQRLSSMAVRVTSDPREVNGVEVLVLAVKPHLLSAVAADIQPYLEARPLIISILAGVTLHRLRASFPGQERLIRAMPNTPMAIGRGVVGIAAAATEQSADGEIARQVFCHAAKVIPIPEEQMDALTAISGSGPAYCFAFAEALYAAALDMGLADSDAQQLVVGTLEGSAAYLASNVEEGAAFPATTLREQVTSPNGTTAAALEVLGKGDFIGLIKAAAQAACDRSREIAQS